MNETEQMNLLLTGMITKMPIEDQEAVKNAAEELRRVVDAYGDQGVIAFSLVGTEQAMKP